MGATERAPGGGCVVRLYLCMFFELTRSSSRGERRREDHLRNSMRGRRECESERARRLTCLLFGWETHTVSKCTPGIERGHEQAVDTDHDRFSPENPHATAAPIDSLIQDLFFAVQKRDEQQTGRIIACHALNRKRNRWSFFSLPNKTKARTLLYLQPS